MTDLDRRVAELRGWVLGDGGHMPEVITIRWNGLYYKVDKPSWMGGKVIALDDLEAWLKEGFDGEGDPYLNLRDLLGQVQA